MHLLWAHPHKFRITALHPAPMEHNHQSGFPAAHAPKTPLAVTGTIRGSSFQLLTPSPKLRWLLQAGASPKI